MLPQSARGGLAYLLLPWSLAMATAPALAQGPECADLAPPQGVDPSWAGKPVTAEDLVRLRDIGPANNEISERPLFAISPDGKQVAFQLRRADPRSNSYCFGMFLTDLREGQAPRQVDAGGEFIMHMTTPYGRANLALGISEVITPRWSPDGRWIAFLKRTGGKTRLWRAFADGSGSRILAEDDAEIDDFRISDDGQKILLRVKSGLAAALAGIAQEARIGFHYDERSSATISPQPLPLTPLAKSIVVIDIASGSRRKTEPGEEALFLPPTLPADVQALDFAIRHDGAIAWTTAGPGLRPHGAEKLTAREPGGRETICMDQSCKGVDGPLWWTQDGLRVRYVRAEGWANNETAIYEWTPGDPKARKLYTTDAYLIDCQADDDDLICLRETSLQPRHLARIDLRTGSVVTLFQPNPEIVAAQKGRVERLFNRNEFGLPSFADLVYPVGYDPRKTYPLIVVQYTSRGFLRGGVGEEYPIQAFANAGFAVLSVNKPQDVGYGSEAKDGIDVDRVNLKDFAQRRSVLSSIETTIIGLIERGIVDPRRIGITGLSDGSSTATFAALHSKLFSAGAVASCCWERSQNVLLGPMMEKPYGLIGWPNITQPAPDFWAQVSLAQNATKLAFPLLMQLADTEYLPALESYTALKQSGAPVDLFVFPDEFHIKWQPAHRMAAYQRSIDWFDYWFRGAIPTDPRRRTEVDRWARLPR